MNLKHIKNKKRLRIIGITLLVVGGILTVIGLFDFFRAFGGGGMPKLFFCAFIGLPLVGFGTTLTQLGYKREIATYLKNESVPVINEAADELEPAIKSVTRSIKDVLKDEKVNYCPKCGMKLDDTDNFCPKCGKKIDR